MRTRSAPFLGAAASCGDRGDCSDTDPPSLWPLLWLSKRRRPAGDTGSTPSGVPSGLVTAPPGEGVVGCASEGGRDAGLASGGVPRLAVQDMSARIRRYRASLASRDVIAGGAEPAP